MLELFENSRMSVSVAQAHCSLCGQIGECVHIWARNELSVSADGAFANVCLRQCLDAIANAARTQTPMEITRPKPYATGDAPRGRPRVANPKKPYRPRGKENTGP